MVLCTTCASRNEDAALFCQGCGGALGALGRVLASPSSAEPQAEPQAVAGRRAALLFGDLAVALERTPLVVGRFTPQGPPVDVDLASYGAGHGVSRRHARLFFDRGCWHVEDLGSTNGTSVQARGAAGGAPAVRGAVALQDGDTLTFGDARAGFRDPHG